MNSLSFHLVQKTPVTSLPFPDVSNVKGMFDLYEQNYQKRMESLVDEVSHFQQQFEDFVTKLLKKKKKKVLIVFIDDLDRCLPDRAIQLLEAIKNFLTVPKCVFVLGVDDQVIAKGITNKYGKGLIDGQSYLEKMITLPFRVAKPRPQFVESYVTKLLTQAVQHSSDDLTTAFESCAHILGLIGQTNPRRLRRIAYRFLLYLTLDEASRPAPTFADIVKLLCLAEFQPELYKVYRDHPMAQTLLTQLQKQFHHRVDRTHRAEIEGDFQQATGLGWEHFLSQPELEKMLQISQTAMTSRESFGRVIDFLSGLQK